MNYINMKNNGVVETVDEFETYKEAKEMLQEYLMAFHGGNVYISQRCTKDWKEK